MKASERLRELSDRPLLHMTEVEPLLPLIADVVEAAERQEALNPEHSRGRNEKDGCVRCDIRIALTALRDALEGEKT